MDEVRMDTEEYRKESSGKRITNFTYKSIVETIFRNWRLRLESE